MPQHRKFEWQKVRELREWWTLSRSIPTLAEVAKREGVNPSVIRDLCEGRTYQREPADVGSMAEGIQKSGFTWSEQRGAKEPA